MAHRSAANVATKLLIWKALTKMGNSPIELLVLGKLILAEVEEKKMVGGFTEMCWPYEVDCNFPVKHQE
jgi:hypothetical protein